LDSLDSPFLFKLCHHLAVHAHHSSSPLWKAIIYVRDLLLQLCEDSESSITLLSSWSTSAGFFLSCAYDIFRPIGSAVSWGWVVWEQWSLPKYSFILWLAVLGKLRTRDRLVFVLTDPNCMFCRQVEESYSHLFFCLWMDMSSMSNDKILPADWEDHADFDQCYFVGYTLRRITWRLGWDEFLWVSWCISFGRKETSGFLMGSLRRVLQCSGAFKSFSTLSFISMKRII